MGKGGGGGASKKKQAASAEKRMEDGSIVQWLGSVNKGCRKHAAAFEDAGISTVDDLKDVVVKGRGPSSTMS